MTFTLSKHAEKRIIERWLEVPTAYMGLKSPGRKIKKKIRAACKLRGFERGKTYWFRKDGTVYVCVQTDIGEYHVITAFKLGDETEKEKFNRV